MNLKYVFFLLLLLFSSVAAQPIKQFHGTEVFAPRLAVGPYVEQPYVEDGNTVKIAGIRLARNINFAKFRTLSVGLEPSVSLGWADFYENKQNNNFAYSFDLAFLFRKKFGPVSLGMGVISGFTNIRHDYLYTAFIGVSPRLGLKLNNHLMLEAHANAQLGAWFAEGKYSAGLSLLWTK